MTTRESLELALDICEDIAAMQCECSVHVESDLLATALHRAWCKPFDVPPPPWDKLTRLERLGWQSVARTVTNRTQHTP